MALFSKCHLSNVKILYSKDVNRRNRVAMEMNPELAKRLFAEGAVLIIAGIPLGTEFGVDLTTYKTGERFRGIKMIPPGPHYIYCSSQGEYGDVAPRVGFIHFFKAGEILVREWDNDKEELRPRRTDNPELEIKRIRDNLIELDKFLGPYDYKSLAKWRQLTDTVTEEAVKRCAPECGIIRTNIELKSCPDSERPRGKNLGEVKNYKNVWYDDLLPNLEPIEGTAPRFTPLPERIPRNCSPSEISQHHMDSIAAVDKCLESFENSDDLMQEIQLSFVFFHPGCSLESLNHWRKLLNILCNSEKAVEKQKLFYMKYLEVLQYQLPQLPSEFMEQNDNNTIYKDVRNLIQNCLAGSLHPSGDRLMESLRKTMKWKFDGILDEDPEDMPVIVET